jgi:hypothetical protein
VQVAHRLSRPSRRTLVAVAVAVVALAVIGIFLARSSLFRGAPSIDRLVSNYKTHRSQFAMLARMASVDPQFSLQITKRGAYLQSEYANALSQDRIKRYEARLRPIGAVTLDSDSNGVDVTLGSSGLVAGGETWGYIRSRQPPAKVVTLKQAHAWFHDSWCYPLGDSWYAYDFNN